jgi:DNA polymerase III epsilon subunit-like protein
METVSSLLKVIYSEPIIVFDTETGGLNPSYEIDWDISLSLKVGDTIQGKVKTVYAPILEIGAVKLNQFTLEEVDKFYSLCGPEEGQSVEDLFSLCSQGALDVNKLDKRKEEFKTAKPLSAVLKNFISWATRESKQFIPAGQNVRFDIDMINAACKRLGIDYQIFNPPIELRDFSSLYFALPDTPIVANYKLTTVASALGLGTEGAHQALEDVKMEAECLRRILKRFTAI